MSVSNASATKDGMDCSALNLFANRIVTQLVDIVMHLETVNVDWDGQVEHAKNVKFCLDVYTATVKNLWNVNAILDILEFCAKLLFVRRRATKNEVTVGNLENAGVK